MQRRLWTNGPHEIEFQEPDFLIFHLANTVKLDEVKEVIRIIREEIVPEVGPPFCFAHFTSGLKSFDPACPKYVASVKPPWKAIAIVGGTRISRVAVNITLRAVNVLSGRETPLRMVESFQEAYAWANELRARQANGEGSSRIE